MEVLMNMIPPMIRPFALAITLVALVLGAAPAAAWAPASVDAPYATLDPDTTDPRIGLAAGGADAEQAIWNLRLLAAIPKAEQFEGVTNSDLAFMDNYVIQGNYNG